jgi:hypothetical protein
MPLSIFEPTENPTRGHWLMDRQKRALLSLVIGGLTVSSPLAYILVLAQREDREWRPLAANLARVAFWPGTCIEPIYEHFFPTYYDPDAPVTPWVSDGLLFISGMSILISIAVYSVVSFIILTWWSRKRRIA